eukprot:TRINITY_DN5053_c0_g1_i1.p2 TRINITY_DN5053_c0_g1~~TRINITY_DN5053_c0_g1_i1.p2  ORF type:complete len:299 (+),score=100.98 TRINITY_DN5053_c0_g1_i1:120-1016(+)
MERAPERAPAGTQDVSKPPVVFLYGWPDNAQVFAPQIAHLTSLGYRCHVIDLPGFAEPLDAAHTWGYSAADTVEFIRRKVADISGSSGGGVILVGHDWGATFGLMVEERHPQLVAKFVSLDIGGAMSPGLITWAIVLWYQTTLALAFLIGGRVGSLMATFIAWAFKAPQTSLPVPARKCYPYVRLFAEMAHARAPVAERVFVPYVTWRLPRCPVLFIYGAQGMKQLCMFHTRKWAEAVASKADSYTVEYKDAGHWVQVAHPERTNALLEAFLAGTDSGAQLLQSHAMPAPAVTAKKAA